MSKRSTIYCFSRIFKASAAALLLSGALTIGYAQAAEQEIRQVKVRFGELDLAKPAGAQALYRRLERAASRVCANPGPIGFAGRSTRQCYQTALTDAVLKVNSPLLSELHGVKPERVAGQK